MTSRRVSPPTLRLRSTIAPPSFARTVAALFTTLVCRNSFRRTAHPTIPAVSRPLLPVAQSRWVGTAGSTLVAVTSWFSGALPEPIRSDATLIPSSALTLTGVALLCLAWLSLLGDRGLNRRGLLRTYLWWATPLLGAAPLFSRDVYSYLAQGAIAHRGLDPYAAGPVTLLGAEDPLAAAVDGIWAATPSPYGPVALGVSGLIASLAGANFAVGFALHRAVAFAATLAIARVLQTPRGLLLAVLNPLALVHFVGGAHNDALMLAFVMVGMRFALREGYANAVAAGVLISLGTLVKAAALPALGFAGIVLARRLRRRGVPMPVLTAAGYETALLSTTLFGASLVTGTGLGWIAAQASSARTDSWLSLTSLLGRALGHQFTVQAAGLFAASVVILAALRATYLGSIDPFGGLSVANFAMVALFPVVQPWYPLWAIVVVAGSRVRNALASKSLIALSVLFCFLALPRGQALEPFAVLAIYALTTALCLCGLVGFKLARHGRSARSRFRSQTVR